MMTNNEIDEARYLLTAATESVFRSLSENDEARYAWETRRRYPVITFENIIVIDRGGQLPPMPRQPLSELRSEALELVELASPAFLQKFASGHAAVAIHPQAVVPGPMPMSAGMMEPWPTGGEL